jgi:hypothetical protein
VQSPAADKADPSVPGLALMEMESPLAELHVQLSEHIPLKGDGGDIGLGRSEPGDPRAPSTAMLRGSGSPLKAFGCDAASPGTKRAAAPRRTFCLKQEHQKARSGASDRRGLASPAPHHLQAWRPSSSQ